MPAAPAPVAPGAQLPPAPGWKIVKLDAVIGPVEPPLAGRAPTTMTQAPGTTAASEAVSVWVNTVDDVHPTVTWPVWGFCTSIDVAVIAATVPDALGVVGRVETLADDGLLETCALVGALADEPHAAASSASAARAVMTPARSAGPLFRRVFRRVTSSPQSRRVTSSAAGTLTTLLRFASLNSPAPPSFSTGYRPRRAGLLFYCPLACWSTALLARAKTRSGLGCRFLRDHN